MKHLVYRDRIHKSGRLVGQVEKYWPDHDSRGLYELADPDFGKEKHHKKNAIYAGSEAAAVSLVKRFGFHLRMRGHLTGQRNLISPEEIKDTPNA
ncbi:hypothetical protein GCM10009096_24060 [Parasphingorhabdus litoris]|uniref:RES domain-containing protein n=1 Tax=Parasphingorhabdus litoris TaxID=394733 RepID=A0ABP3KJC3_9SPHN|nr:hypothetical protein [Parasphingorhabdus litoris]